MTASELEINLGTAAAHSTREVPVAAPADTVGEVFESLRGKAFDSAAVIAVVRGDRLEGLCTIERLLAARPDATISSVMDRRPPMVGPGTNQEHAAWQAVQRNEPGLAVVDDRKRLIGVIPPQRLLGVLLKEHEEDLARFGGFGARTDAARTASEERVSQRLWHRLPWLLLGLIGAMLTATLLGAFESKLAGNLAVAFFIPGIVYLAAAVGVQTQTVSIRGLSVGVGIRRVAGREVVTGMLVGGILALAMLPLVWVLHGNSALATAVSLSVFVASTVATVVALVFPWLLNRFGRDPAFGSGPLATVIQDLLSLLTYLTAVSLLL
ncbi:MAG TPA: magnesium transporter [Candidatus Limnocylindrales bacterium]|nr:magnesium transporter [Candidatus Limnocylindrales bacterium]